MISTHQANRLMKETNMTSNRRPLPMRFRRTALDDILLNPHLARDLGLSDHATRVTTCHRRPRLPQI